MDISNAAWVSHIDNHTDTPFVNNKSQTSSHGVVPNYVDITLYCIKILRVEEMLCNVNAGNIFLF